MITYARVVVDYSPPQIDPNRVRINAGGNLIQYPGELTMIAVDLNSYKLLWNNVISTYGAEYMCVDINIVYPGTPLNWYEYMRVPLALLPEHTIEPYDLRTHSKNDFVYVEIRKAIYGLPKDGALKNKLLKERLTLKDNLKVPHPWPVDAYHTPCPIYPCS